MTRGWRQAERDRIVRRANGAEAAAGYGSCLRSGDWEMAGEFIGLLRAMGLAPEAAEADGDGSAGDAGPALAVLRRDWGAAYETGTVRDIWRARRRGGPGRRITAGDAGELGRKIAADYAGSA